MAKGCPRPENGLDDEVRDPWAFARALAAAREAVRLGLPLPAGFLSELDLFCHGTTVATNTLLTATGAKTGLILTEGFRDTLEMRRAHKLARKLPKARGWQCYRLPAKSA